MESGCFLIAISTLIGRVKNTLPTLFFALSTEYLRSILYTLTGEDSKRMIDQSEGDALKFEHEATTRPSIPPKDLPLLLPT